MTIDERLAALTVNVEVMSGMMKDLIEAQKVTDEHINSLARIAESHERRLTHLEDGGNEQ